MRNKRSQRGESKVGCTISFLVLAILIAVALKLVPVLFSNNDFLNSVENIAGRAGVLPQATIEAQIRQKIKELEIPEALAPGAVVITKVGDNMAGTCTVRVKYTRKIDFYGVFTLSLETDKTKSIPYVDAR